MNTPTKAITREASMVRDTFTSSAYYAQLAREMYHCVYQRHTKHSGKRSPVRRMAVMAFRQEVARTYIQEEAGENGQDDTGRRRRYREQSRRQDAGDRRDCINKQPFESLLLI